MDFALVDAPIAVLDDAAGPPVETLPAAVHSIADNDALIGAALPVCATRPSRGRQRCAIATTMPTRSDCRPQFNVFDSRLDMATSIPCRADPSVATINGAPAVVFWETFGGSYQYCGSSLDLAGNVVWNLPSTALGAGAGPLAATLTSLPGDLPAFSFYSGLDGFLKFSKSSDPTGAAWAVPFIGRSYRWTTAASVDDSPAGRPSCTRSRAAASWLARGLTMSMARAGPSR